MASRFYFGILIYVLIYVNEIYMLRWEDNIWEEILIIFYNYIIVSRTSVVNFRLF